MADEQNETVANELDTVADNTGQESAAGSEQTSVEDVIPEKYRGKSVKDLVTELETANKNMGRYANELGDVRKLADELIKSTLQKPKVEEVQHKEVDFFENPQEAIKRAVESNPEVQAAKQYALQAKQDIARRQMLDAHPDAFSILQDSSFHDWIGKSEVRKELLQRADSKFDVNAANELFSTYKELKAIKTAAVSDTETAARKQAVNSASVDSGGSGEKSKKILKRADIMNLMIRDRRKYDSMKDEIELAYAEGRVR